MPPRMHRCGLLIAARALATSADTGIVITASHNPEQDNGVKLVEPDGSMLCSAWEVGSYIVMVVFCTSGCFPLPHWHRGGIRAFIPQHHRRMPTNWRHATLRMPS